MLNYFQLFNSHDMFVKRNSFVKKKRIYSFIRAHNRVCMYVRIAYLVHLMNIRVLSVFPTLRLHWYGKHTIQ